MSIKKALLRIVRPADYDYGSVLYYTDACQDNAKIMPGTNSWLTTDYNWISDHLSKFASRNPAHQGTANLDKNAKFVFLRCPETSSGELRIPT